MKKYILLALFIVLAAPILASQVAHAQQEGNCQGSPRQDFPYNFLCGHSNSDRASLQMARTGSTPEPQTSSTYEDTGDQSRGLPVGTIVGPGQELGMKAAYSRSAGSEGRPVLVWITVQGSNRSIVHGSAGFTEKGSGGNDSLNCPGVPIDGLPRPGPVYGQPESPAAFTGTSGVTNCLYGQMLYYENVPDSRNDFFFRFKLADNASGTVCFRTTVSMAANGISINRPFPAGSSTRYDRPQDIPPDERQRGVLASWVVKQSDLYCYTVPEINQPPTGEWYFEGCDNGTGVRAIHVNAGDPNRPTGSRVEFRIVEDGGAVRFQDYAVQGAHYKRFPEKGLTEHRFRNGTRYTLQVGDYNADGLRVGWVSKQTYTPNNCPNPDCQRFRRNTEAGSEYRYTVFKSRAVGETSSPNPTTRSPLGSPPWKNFNSSDIVSRAFIRAPSNSSSNLSITSTSGHSGWSVEQTGGQRVVQFNYPNPERDWVVYVEKWQRGSTNSSSPDFGTWNYSSIRLQQVDCYGGSVNNPDGNCSIVISGADIPTRPNGFSEGATVTVTATLRNDANETLPENFGGSRLALNGTGGPHYIGRGLGAGDSQTVSFTTTAPTSPDPGTHSVTLYPDYFGLRGIGPACTATYDTYKRYDFSAFASNTLDRPEDPTSVTFSTKITKTRGVDVDGTVTRTFEQRRNNAPRQFIPSYSGSDAKGNPHSSTFVNTEYSDVYNIPPPNVLGDYYCVTIVLDRGGGWRGPNNTYVNEREARATDCPEPPFTPNPSVVNRPYVRVYSGDIAAGGGFGPSCGHTESLIKTFTSPVPRQKPVAPGDERLSNKSGSGTQLAALALGDISGFTSASMRSTNPLLPRGLTFANTTPMNPTNGDDDGTRFGGRLATGDGWCAPDYFRTTQLPNDDASKQAAITDSSPISPNDPALEPGHQSVFNLDSGFKTLTSAPNYTKKHTMYVDGNVYISGNIAYRAQDWTTIAEIPNFTLVVRGNIYISNQVSQLDGLYIAQPREGVANSGRIYTCANSGAGIVAPGAMFTDCGASGPDKRQLVVNGAFIAQKVVLNRTGYSLRDSTYQEPHTNTRAAEVFNYTPELYLSPPIFWSNSSPTSGNYESISTLAPIL